MGLFENIRYSVASSIPPHRQEQLEYALSKNGATKAGSILDATHVISDSPWLEGASELENLKEASNKESSSVPLIVSDAWVDRTLILGKIQPPQYYSVDPAMVFSGVVACAAELQAHDLEVLSAGISALGGQWRVALTNDVTHLFCISPSSTKYAVALAHREGTGIKIVLPHWFDDSVRLGMRGLPVEPYEWPDPPFLKEIGVDMKNLTHAGQNDDDKEGKEKCQEDEGRLKEKAKKNMMITANQFTPSVTNIRTPLPKDVDLLPVKRGVFDHKQILLSWTLSLYGSRREAVEMGIRRAGGLVLRYPGDHDDDLSTEEKERRRDKKEARAVKECDILITRWRNGKAYGKAFKLHKTIGTMAWLYHVQSSGLTPRPIDQLLHYPIPRKSIPNFLQHEITVTNYTGEAREYIKRIITAMGAKFTPMMTGKNTVLIAAYLHGQKTDKARTWSLPIVNHTWLEDCFIQWRHLTTSTDKYITFPPGMDFSRLLGERGVGVRGVELCDEEETKEDEGSSDEEIYGAHIKMDEEEDEVLKDVEEDIDMISMPDTDQPGLDVAFEHIDSDNRTSNLPTNEGSSTKQGAVAVSSSPRKRSTNSVAGSSAVQVSPLKSRSKSVSPTKRQLIASVADDDDEENNNVEQPEHSEKKKKSRIREPNSASHTPQKSIAMDVSSEEVVTPARKLKPKPKSIKKKTPSKRQSLVDSELTDDTTSELNKTPDFISKIRGRANGVEEDDSPKKKRRIEKEKEKSPRKKNPVSRVESDEDVEREQVEKDVDGYDARGGPPLLKPKKKLVRRLTKGASLQLTEQREKEKAKAGASSTAESKRLTRRTTGKPLRMSTSREPTPHTENGAESAVSTSKQKSPKARPQKKEKLDVRKVSLLDVKRGDARTRVKAKSASAKAREMYSDGEGEVEEFVVEKTQDKGKRKQETRAKKGVRGKKGSSSSEQEKESAVVESESEDGDEDEKRNVSGNKTLPSKKSVPDAAKLPSSIKKAATKNLYRGLSRAEEEEEEAVQGEIQGDENEESPTEDGQELLAKRSPRHDSVKNVESIHAEADEAPSAFVSRPRSKLKPKSARTRSSPISTSRTDPKHINTDGNSEDLDQLPTRRGAATKAEAKLKEMMPDASKYEQEAKQARKSGGWTSLWEKELEKEKGKATSKKRNLDVAEDAEQEGPSRKRRRSLGVVGKMKEEIEENRNQAEAGAKEAKKGRASTSAPKENIFLLTTQVALATDVVKALEKLGVIMSTQVSQCTHLIAPGLVRTEKFLCALAFAPVILQEAWAVKSVQVKQLLPVGEFLLYDTVAETKYRMKLSEALTRAKENKGTLLRNKTFYVTMKTKVEYKLLKNVVTAHGGQLSHQPPTVRLLTGHANRHVISCPEDISIWRPLAMQGIPIFTHEFLLTGVLRQELEWDSKDFRVQGSL